MELNIKQTALAATFLLGMSGVVYGSNQDTNEILSFPERRALIEQFNDNNILNPVQESLLATAPGLTPESIRSIFEVARNCLNIESERGDFAKLAMFGVPISADGAVSQFVLKGVGCGFESRDNTTYAGIEVDASGFINQLLTIQSNKSPNPLGLDPESAPEFIDEQARGTILAYTANEFGEVYAINPTREVGVTEVLTDRQLLEYILEAFQKNGLCGFIPPVNISGTVKNKAAFVGFQIDGEQFELKFCEHHSTSTGNIGEDELNFDALPYNTWKQVVDSMEENLYSSDGSQRYPFRPDPENGMMVLDIRSIDEELVTKVILYSEDPVDGNMVGSYIVGFKTSHVKNNLPHEEKTDNTLKHTALLLGAALTFGSVAFFAASQTSRIKKAFTNSKNKNGHKAEPHIIENVETYANLLTSLNSNEIVDIVETIKQINEFSRVLNTYNDQQLAEEMKQAIASRLGVKKISKQDNNTIGKLIYQIRAYNAGSVSMEGSFAYKLAASYLKNIKPDEGSTDLVAINSYNKVLADLRNAFNSNFGLQEIKVTNEQVASETVIVDGVAIDNTLDSFAAHLKNLVQGLDVNTKARVDRSAKELKAEINLALQHFDNFEQLNRFLKARTRVLKNSIQGDTVFIDYKVTDNKTDFGHFVVEVNGETKEIEIEFYEKLPREFSPKLSTREKRALRARNQMMQVESETGEPEQKSFELISKELSFEIARNISSTAGKLENLEGLLQAWANYSEVKNLVTDNLSAMIENGTLEIIGTETSEASNFSSVIAKRLYKYIAKLENEPPVKLKDLPESVIVEIEYLEEQGLTLIDGSLSKSWIERDQNRLQFARFIDGNGVIHTKIFFSGHGH